VRDLEYGADLIALPSLLPKLPLHIAAILTACISVVVTDRSDQRSVTQALDWLRALPIEQTP